MTVNIRLPKSKWTFDPKKPLGPAGGFGEVFCGLAPDGKPVAVKRLKISAKEAAHRELRIADLLAGTEFRHVMPFYDAGQDAESDRYYIIMPEAEFSLSQKIEAMGQMKEKEALQILQEIVLGLIEVDGLVHRDLKPGNVLFYKSSWRIADFGISRFVEESTSLRTLKNCLSPAFAAPEQWQFERASHATDIYALGCIGYFLLKGKTPFPGPSREDYKEQHLKKEPPSPSNCLPQLQSTILMMLRKAPESRPTPERVSSIFESLYLSSNDIDPSKKFSALAEAGANVAKRQAEEEARKSLEELERQRRIALANEAKSIFNEIVKTLFKKILDTAPNVEIKNESKLKLGQATLFMRLIGNTKGYDVNKCTESDWDIVLGGEIGVLQENPRYIWSSSLWYSKLSPSGDFRWREVSYFGDGGLSTNEPYSLHNLADADRAAGRSVGAIQIAFGPDTIDDETLSDFEERWTSRFARAAEGKLQHPRYLPLPVGLRRGPRVALF